MVTIETLKALRNNDGMTLKNGEAITYKTGWQVSLTLASTSLPMA